jgi:hypothetical protein
MEAHPALLPRLERSKRVQDRAEAAVQFPAQHQVDASHADVGHEPRPVLAPRHIGGGHLVDVLPDPSAARERALAHRHQLDLWILLLVAGAHPGVEADPHGRSSEESSKAAVPSAGTTAKPSLECAVPGDL